MELCLPVHILFLLASLVFTLLIFPSVSLGNLLRVGISWSSALVNSVAISKHFKVAVRENVHKEAAFFHSLLLFLW